MSNPPKPIKHWARGAMLRDGFCDDWLMSDGTIQALTQTELEAFNPKPKSEFNVLKIFDSVILYRDGE